jgi:transposase-like protein
MKAGNAKRYNREFKLQAARLVVELGYTYAKTAEQLGTTVFSVRNWVQKFRQEGIFPPVDQPVPQADELKTLRKELAQLKMENQILKKAAAYFAKESL